MKLLILITLLFASQAMASLTKIEKAEATLEFYQSKELTPKVAKKIEMLTTLIANEKLGTELKAFIDGRAEVKKIATDNKNIDKQIDALTKLDLNVNDLCLTYIVEVVEKDLKEGETADVEIANGNGSCFSRATVNGKSPSMTHKELIAYFNADIAAKTTALLEQKK